MRLRHIEIFHAVYSAGSVTGAAELLCVSQPSVSKVLRHAEQELGFKLFDRVKGKLVPTPEADHLFSHAVTVYDSMDRLRRIAGNIRTAEEGGIRIAATPAFGIDFLPRVIAAYHRLRSGIVFHVETLHHDEICKALLEARIDLGLVFDPDLQPGIAANYLTTGRFVAMTPSQLEFDGKDRLTLTDLAEHAFVKLDGRGPLGRLLSSYMQANKARVNTVAHTETYQVAKALVAHGVGVTITDEVTARSSGHDGVVARPLDPPLRFRIAVLHVDAAPISIVSANFIDLMKGEIESFLEGPL